MRIGFVAQRNKDGSFSDKKIPIGDFHSVNEPGLDRLVTPLTEAYKRYCEACKKRGIEPD